MRPGSTSAPGVGVDIKHNSYDRYLAKLKGRGPLRTEKENIICHKNNFFLRNNFRENINVSTHKSD